MNGYKSGKIADYQLDNKDRSKLILNMAELILVISYLPVSIWLVKNLFNHRIEVNTWEAFVFFTFLIMSWFVLKRITSMAVIPRNQRYRTLVFQYAKVTFIVFLGLIAVKVLFRLTSIPVLLIMVTVVIMFSINLLFRLLAFKVLKRHSTYRHGTHQVLLIADAFSDGIIQKLIVQKEWGFRIQCIVSDSKLINAKYGKQIKIIPCRVSMISVIDAEIIDEVIYCKRKVDIDLIREVMVICNEVGVIFRLQPSVSLLYRTDFQLKTFNNRSDLSIVDTPSNTLHQVIKNMADIYFSILAIIMMVPFLIVIVTAIKIDTKGPVFFRQERIGRRGRKFILYKFRTMHFNAEKQLKDIKAMNEADGPVFKIRHDPRITKIGKFLRKTGFDELPQLFNVIRGEMSLIGPRPPLEEEVKQYERWHLRRLSVKPGITCSWQVVPNRHDIPFESWMKMDLHYIDNWNLAKDVVLFIKTVRTFFVAGGH